MFPDRKNKISVNAYVKLKKEFDQTDLYRNVESGATGWVRERKIDDDGFRMIFIEWDETNPKYAGEIDKWVFENHFEVISEKYYKNKTAERYIEKIKMATDAALASDAFMLVAVKKHKGVEGIDIFQPTLLSADMSTECRLILEAQISYMASQLFQEYIQDTLDFMKDKEDEDEPRW